LSVEANSPSLIRLPEVERRVGLKKSAIYERIAAGHFPRPVPLTQKAIAFVSTEIDAWISDRIRLRKQLA
jgi:prophage regulatory protein